jgi:hypothetical protein
VSLELRERRLHTLPIKEINGYKRNQGALQRRRAVVYESAEENPFTPSFGEVPLVMAGRDQLIREFDRALQSTSRRPCLTSLISGARGTGKTALLTLIEGHAQQYGWIAVDLVSLPGLLEDAYEQSRLRAQHLVDEKDNKTHLASLSVGPLGVGVTRDKVEKANWRTRMNALLDDLSKQNGGLLFTIDEITPKLDELVQFVSTYQLFVREGRKVALLMAGLLHNTSALLKDKSVSFLRRAQAIALGRIADFEIEKALRDTFAHSSRSISEKAITEAVEVIDGFPFMMQLVGFRIWEEGVGDGQIEEEAAQRGMMFAKEEMKSRILLPSYQELSAMDKRFLHAMAQDQVDSSVPGVAERLKRSNSYATQYKNRLLEQGLIGLRGAGRVGFELPVMREFLAEQSVEE